MSCLCHYQDHGRGGLSSRGVAAGSLHGGFDGFGGSGEHLTLRLLVLQNAAQLGNRGGFGGHGGFSHDGYPP